MHIYIHIKGKHVIYLPCIGQKMTFDPPLHLSPMISMFMALLIIPSNIYTSQFSHDDHLLFRGEEIWEVPQKGHTWGYFALEPGSGVGLVDFASSSLPVLSHCWFRRGAISPSRLFSDVRKHKHIFLYLPTTPQISYCLQILGMAIVGIWKKRDYFYHWFNSTNPAFFLLCKLLGSFLL